MFVVVVGAGVVSLSFGLVSLLYGLLGAGIPPQGPAVDDDIPGRKLAWLIRTSSFHLRIGAVGFLVGLPVVVVGAVIDRRP